MITERGRTRTDGKSLAAVSTTLTASGAESAGTYDITTLVAERANGDVADDGILLSASDETTATSGVGYAGPTAASGAASIKVTYTPPAVPSVPTSLTTTAGDDGVLVAWAEPASTGYVEGENATDNDDATNPVGTGPAASATGVSPEAVPGGPTQYVQAVSQMLNARDGLEKGTLQHLYRRTGLGLLLQLRVHLARLRVRRRRRGAHRGVGEQRVGDQRHHDPVQLPRRPLGGRQHGDRLHDRGRDLHHRRHQKRHHGHHPGEAVDQDAYSFSVTGTGSRSSRRTGRSRPTAGRSRPNP